MKERILVAGVGDTLLGDEGAGVHAVRELARRFRFPVHVSLEDAGTSGLYLVSAILGAGKVLVLDAMRLGKPPGTIARLDGGALGKALGAKVSPHELGLRDILSAARLKGSEGEVVILGVEPERLGPGLELSPAVAAAIPRVMDAALDELWRWGVRPLERQPLEEDAGCTSSR